ncbi:MAG TPA: hypothetical protein VMR86_21490 [Myxococcota bacterium]|nr:hypothetical protein [Myxococcota bacterium]
MPDVPSIKATGFQSAADDIARLIESGRLSRAELEAQLEPDDLGYLGKQLAASGWVPVATYLRVLELLIALEAGRDVHKYLRERGMRAAERLHKLGLYGQFEATVETWGHRVGTIAATMGAVLYNFSRWSFESNVEAGTFQTTVDDARHYADPLITIGEGFIEYLAQNLLAGYKVEVTGTRTKPDQVVFRGHFS